MRSRVNEELRRELREEVLKLSPQERIDLALRLGREAVANYAAAHQVTHDEALRILRKGRHAGRRYSRCMEELDS